MDSEQLKKSAASRSEMARGWTFKPHFKIRPHGSVSKNGRPRITRPRMKVDTIGIGWSPVLLDDGGRIDANITESQGRLIFLPSIMVHESTDHKNIFTWANFVSCGRLFSNEHILVEDGHFMFFANRYLHDRDIETRIKMPLNIIERNNVGITVFHIQSNNWTALTGDMPICHRINKSPPIFGVSFRGDRNKKS